MHCTVNYHKGEYWGGRDGCDAQGFYSILACFSTMFYTIQITYLSYVAVKDGEYRIRWWLH